MTRSLPYVSVAASLVPMVGVTLSASAKTGVELADPVDGVAGRTAAIELGATWTLTPEVTLSATLAGQQEQGLFEESLQQSVRMAKLGASYALSQRVALGTTLRWARHDDPGESYDKAGLALSMNASF
jgi:predicted porin